MPGSLAAGELKVSHVPAGAEAAWRRAPDPPSLRRRLGAGGFPRATAYRPQGHPELQDAERARGDAQVHPPLAVPCGRGRGAKRGGPEDAPGLRAPARHQPEVEGLRRGPGRVLRCADKGARCGDTPVGHHLHHVRLSPPHGPGGCADSRGCAGGEAGHPRRGRPSSRARSPVPPGGCEACEASDLLRGPQAAEADPAQSARRRGRTGHFAVRALGNAGLEWTWRAARIAPGAAVQDAPRHQFLLVPAVLRRPSPGRQLGALPRTRPPLEPEHRQAGSAPALGLGWLQFRRPGATAAGSNCGCRGRGLKVQYRGGQPCRGVGGRPGTRGWRTVCGSSFLVQQPGGKGVRDPAPLRREWRARRQHRHRPRQRVGLCDPQCGAVRERRRQPGPGRGPAQPQRRLDAGKARPRHPLRQQRRAA
mmetsp:Transcript_2627/g.8450  ORF Transcript_2627/g.8450 Transcript_2627/m.8450 type:complete len:420 (-) Transcript_2627:1313-2572(-)